MKAILLFSAGALLSSAAYADTVYNTSLPPVNASGTGVVTTVTGPTGTLTTVTGPGGSANRAGATPVFNQWEQENVGGNASVGITTTYARSGNGSAFFQGTDGNSKADMEYYFGNVGLLSSFQSLSYDWYRSSASTTSAVQVPSLRLLVTNQSQYAALIFEPVYNGVSPAPTDAWQTSTIGLDSTFWSNNNYMAKPAGTAACPDCYLTLAQWQTANPNWYVYGLSTGIGSGWSGSFVGAVDNISYSSNQIGSKTFNFEVAQDAAVPEPATWGMMVLGFGLLGGAVRRRRNAPAVA